jgi:hypothetical protein
MVSTEGENKESGKLTSILTRVLRWVSSYDYEDCGDYMLFGTTYDGIRETVFDEIDQSDLPQSTSDGEDAAWSQEVSKAAEIVKRYASRLRVDRRTTLNKDADLGKLAREARLSESGRAFLESLPVEDIKEVRSGPQSEGLIEEHFANEMVAKLPKIVKRVISWDELAPEEIQRDLPPEDVKRYWEEAHRCYLYGFPVACVVLCRAILESALVQMIDRKRAIQRQTPKDVSYFANLIEHAKERGILTDDRPACAMDVRDAGNEAIHDYKEFQKRLQDARSVAKIVDSTRKILIDLYSQ